MLHTFAIEPDVLTTWDRCRVTLNLMGFQHGRAIAAYPSWAKWKKLILRACNACPNCGEKEFTRIHEKILDSEHKVLRIRDTSDYDESGLPSDEAWIRNATRFHDREALFRAILSTRNPNWHPDVVIDEDIDESHPKLAVTRDPLVLREPAALSSHIRRLVCNSRNLYLIDPHFDPSVYRWRPVITACMALAAAPATDTRIAVTVHTLDSDGKPSLSEFKRRCEHHMPAMLLAGQLTSARVCRWRTCDAAEADFHARYVLTERGGYWLDKGLDEEHGVEQRVALLSDQERQELWNRYTGASPFLERAGEFTIVPDPAKAAAAQST